MIACVECGSAAVAAAAAAARDNPAPPPIGATAAVVAAVAAEEAELDDDDEPLGKEDEEVMSQASTFLEERNINIFFSDISRPDISGPDTSRSDICAVVRYQSRAGTAEGAKVRFVMKPRRIPPNNVRQNLSMKSFTFPMDTPKIGLLNVMSGSGLKKSAPHEQGRDAFYNAINVRTPQVLLGWQEKPQAGSEGRKFFWKVEGEIACNMSTCECLSRVSSFFPESLLLLLPPPPEDSGKETRIEFENSLKSPELASLFLTDSMEVLIEMPR